MIELIVLGMGFYGLCTGKFSASKGRMLTGAPARLCSLILLAHLPISFAGGFALGFFGVAQDSWYPLIISLISLFLVITVSSVVANRYCARLNVEARIPEHPGSTPLDSFSGRTGDFPETDSGSPYAVVGVPQSLRDSVLRQIGRGLVLAGGASCTLFIGLVMNARGAHAGVSMTAPILCIVATILAYRLFRPAGPVSPAP